MKSIMILRHAEAALNSKIDHNRSLTIKGEKDSNKIGQYIESINHIPQLVITSSANRALSTAKNVISAGKWGSNLNIESSIYGGKPDYLLSLLSKQKNEYDIICLIGHEPNFSTFIAKITDNIYRPLRTASIVLINLDIVKWENIQFGMGTLSWHIEPKLLK